MGSPGKVQLNLRVAPELRAACGTAATRAGLSLNLWAEGVLAVASDARGMEQAPVSLPGREDRVAADPALPAPAACPECASDMEPDPGAPDLVRCVDCGFSAAA